MTRNKDLYPETTHLNIEIKACTNCGNFISCECIIMDKFEKCQPNAKHWIPIPKKVDYSKDEEIRMCSNCGYKNNDDNCNCINDCVDSLQWIPIKTPDPVNSPEHYTSGGIECIEAIRSALTPDEFRGFIKGNIIKYAWREKIKNGDEDLKKIVKYIELLFKKEK